MYGVVVGAGVGMHGVSVWQTKQGPGSNEVEKIQGRKHIAPILRDIYQNRSIAFFGLM